MMRILIVCSYKEKMPEGCVPFIREQVAALREQGCESEYFHVKGKGIVGYLKAVPKLRAKIKEFRPDVIHAHYGLSCLVANLATRRVPVVSTYHGSDINEPKVLPFSKMAMWLSAWNIFVSKRNMALAGAIEGQKASLVPCGISLSEDQLQTREEARKALGWDKEVRGKSEEIRVLFAGAFDNAVKDPELAMQAMAVLRAKSQELRVELVELKGYTREEVNRLMCAVDCLLMTSKTEGSPQVIKEAMACGCPIVSVDVGDVAERTVGVDGCYVVPSREPKDIAEALEKAITFEGRTNGREKIIEYGLTNEIVAKKIMGIYESVSK